MIDYAFRFPKDFVFGTANSAFQSEGAWDRDGKSMSNLDHYARLYAGKFLPGIVKKGYVMTTDTPDIGCFVYDNYEAYIEDMKKTGQDSFRMSVSWPRMIPDGVGEVNPKAVDFYNRVINKLLECGITPLVDIFHWDMPQCLQEKGGFRNPDFPKWYENYARVCFEHFGDRVKMWSTFNEACVCVTTGYIKGRFPPFESDLKGGLLAGHHLILAHFRAVRLYRSMNQGGKIGAVHAITPVFPADTTQQDIGAALRQASIIFDWWAEPMIHGRYPAAIVDDCPEYLANMPENFARDLQENFAPMDFLGVNYYTTKRTCYDADSPALSRWTENWYTQPGMKNEFYPQGLLDMLIYLNEKYHGTDIYITENGMALPGDWDVEHQIHDKERVDYLREHLRMLARAIRMGLPLKGYYYWNDADSYEQLSGYSQLYGLTYVNRETGERIWKDSRYYYQKCITTRMVD